ncbi:MAG: hypothetical protein ACLVJO_01455 [[Clostridium] scindens]
MRKEKERLEQYFQTLVRHLPGGVAVVRYEKDGAMIPEFISDGFAAMTEMDMDDAWELYSSDAMAEFTRKTGKSAQGNGKVHRWL